MTELRNMFLHGKPARILVGIKRGHESKYASILSREADCTYSHTVKILNTFQDHDLVKFEKEGRKKLVDLTDEGAELARKMESIMEHLDEIPN